MAPFFNQSFCVCDFNAKRADYGRIDVWAWYCIEGVAVQLAYLFPCTLVDLTMLSIRAVGDEEMSDISIVYIPIGTPILEPGSTSPVRHHPIHTCSDGVSCRISRVRRVCRVGLEVGRIARIATS
jgi:hypothetical protein